VFKKTLAFAVPAVVAAGVLAGTTAGAAPTQSPATSDSGRPHVTQAAKAAVDTVACDGGTQKKVYNRGVNGWVWAQEGSNLTIPGSLVKLKGPASGKDVVTVSFTGLSWVSASSEGRLKVLIDGQPMEPSDPFNGTVIYPGSGGTYIPQATQYCAKIGPGGHSVKVVMQAYDYGAAGTAYFYLRDPMLHVETSN